MLFRKKPIVIEAFKASDLVHWAENEWKNLPTWIVEAYDQGKILFVAPSLVIKTLEGDMEAQCSDWIIRGIKGEIYPCKDEIFRESYEPVEYSKDW